MTDKIVLKAEDLDGYLTEEDQNYLMHLNGIYNDVMESFRKIHSGGFSSSLAMEEQKVINGFNTMGHLMQEICDKNPSLKVFSFVTKEENHAEASRVIAKLRDGRTDNREFVYYTQRAFEMLFKMAYTGDHSDKKIILW